MIFGVIKDLFALLTPVQRRQFYKLQVLVILTALSELAIVASVGPFMALIGDPDFLQRDNLISEFYVYAGFGTPYDFIFSVGVMVLIILGLGASISMFTMWRLTLFANNTGVEIGDRLFNFYVKQPWQFHAMSNSSELIKQITVETQRVTNQIINPLMQMNAKLVLAVCLSVAIFVYNPMVSIVGLVMFSMAYFIIFLFVRKKLLVHGSTISKCSSSRFKILSEGFGGVKDILLLGRQSYFTGRFLETGQKLAYANGSNQAIGILPRYFMEFVAFGTVISLVLYLIKYYEGDLGEVLPILGIYALAGLKLLPAFQQIYGSLATIRAGTSAFNSIRGDLVASAADMSKLDKGFSVNHTPVVFIDAIELKDVSFKYEGKKKFALSSIDIEIPANSVVGFVGESGSGKSTIIDIFTGLISPQSGQLLVDNIPINTETLRSWQDRIGFVPQSIFLSDASILENIAFGIPAADIDLSKIEKAVEYAHLSSFIDTLPSGLNTMVGERGVQLSGGQRQRIGIARSLYDDPDVLILDEATSALDGLTEKLIMEAINEFAGKKTIIMIAHRLATVQKCDKIFFISKGRVADVGTYQELCERNSVFENMAANS